MQSSLSTSIFANYRLEDALSAIARAGFAGADIWGGRPHAYRGDLGAVELAAARAVLDGEGLGVASFIPAQFRYPTSLCSPMEQIRRDSVAYIADALHNAAALGSPIVSVCPGHTLVGQTVEDGWARLSDSLHEVCAAARPLGVRIALEPADRWETDLVQTTAESLRMVEELGEDNFGIVLDNGHAALVGDSAVDAVTRLGDRLFHVHIDDNNGQRDQHLVPGDGAFDFPPFIAALRRAGYAGYVCAELSWDFSIDPEPVAHRCAGVLSRLLA